MVVTQHDLYNYRVHNLRRVESAIRQIARRVRLAISSSDDAALDTFRPVYFLLIAIWSECRLQKLIHEPKFTIVDRAIVNSKNALIDKWLILIEYAFRQKYDVKTKQLDNTTLPFSACSKYKELTNLINNELQPVLKLRNKLAHGQWVYPFNDKGSDVVPEMYKTLKDENFLSWQYKRKLLGSITDMIHDLVVSRETFERDFDKHYSQLMSIKRDLGNRSYKSWVESMRRKHQRGRIERQNNFANAS